MSDNTAPSTFKRWKSIRDHLTCAIDDYLDASTELCNTLSLSMQSSFPRPLLEQTLSALDLELGSLRLDEKRLKRTRMTLARKRNKAHSVVPIHKLPHEILVVIFMLSGNQVVRYDRTSTNTSKVAPTVLAGVCTSWRQLAIKTPSIWSHIAVVIGGLSITKRYNQAALWAERSKQLPLYMEIHDYAYKVPTHPVYSHQISRLTTFLAPLMTRIDALEMRFSPCSNAAISSVLKCWVESGSAFTNKSLKIIIDNTKENIVVLGPTSQISAGEFNVFFRSIQRVALYGCRFSELVSFHAGLVELCLQRPESLRDHTQRDLYAILSATPRLRQLSLVGYHIEPSEIPPPRVTLQYLNSLCVESYDNSFSLTYILPIVHITSPSLDLILTLDDAPEFINAVREFFDRTRVRRLLIKDINGASSSSSSLRAILCPMIHLETLAIEDFEISDNVPDDFLGVSRSGGSRAPWPRLRTLYLKHTYIDMRRLQRLAVAHSLTRLYLHDPSIIQGVGWDITDEERQELEELMYMVEDFKIYLGGIRWAADDWDFSILDL